MITPMCYISFGGYVTIRNCTHRDIIIGAKVTLSRWIDGTGCRKTLISIAYISVSMAVNYWTWYACIVGEYDNNID